MHSEICPICKGKGLIPENYPVPMFSDPSEKLKVCHGCGGLGWVEVNDSYWIWPYTQPYEWDTTGTSNNDNVIISFEFSKKKK